MDVLNNSHSDLIEQLRKLARHNRHGSYATRERYFDAGVQFCNFLETAYHLKSLRNIAPKHIVAYVQDMQTRGLTPSTIKTNLSALTSVNFSLLSSPEQVCILIGTINKINRSPLGERFILSIYVVAFSSAGVIKTARFLCAQSTLSLSPEPRRTP